MLTIIMKYILTYTDFSLIYLFIIYLYIYFIYFLKKKGGNYCPVIFYILLHIYAVIFYILLHIFIFILLIYIIYLLFIINLLKIKKSFKFKS